MIKFLQPINTSLKYFNSGFCLPLRIVVLGSLLLQHLCSLCFEESKMTRLVFTR